MRHPVTGIICSVRRGIIVSEVWMENLPYLGLHNPQSISGALWLFRWTYCAVERALSWTSNLSPFYFHGSRCSLYFVTSIAPLEWAALQVSILPRHACFPAHTLRQKSPRVVYRVWPSNTPNPRMFLFGGKVHTIYSWGQGNN